ncbi:MAG: sulfite exporter TauE/SafE family protein, partial [Anaerolineaceae bacterium]|nr:sulfite exporter TauE/SafE family protein [Anaerolineaceae bacterium]
SINCNIVLNCHAWCRILIYLNNQINRRSCCTTSNCTDIPQIISNGATPRKTIGSVNLTEFFVTFAEALTFIATLGTIRWNVVLGLILGGVIAAPLGAFLTKKIPVKPMMLIVGGLIIVLSSRTILGALS